MLKWISEKVTSCQQCTEIIIDAYFIFRDFSLPQMGCCHDCKRRWLTTQSDKNNFVVNYTKMSDI